MQVHPLLAGLVLFVPGVLHGQEVAASVHAAPELETLAGLEVSTFAQTPLLYNPTALDVDARGRVWVAEAVDYRRWDGRNPGYSREGGDRIVVLEDRDGDGRAEHSTVFAQDPDLVAPLGILVRGKQVLVSCSPNAWLYTDDDGDLVADRRELFLTGFGGYDHDHGLHSFVGGPDGRLHLAVGNAGPHQVLDRDGFELRSGSLYNDGGPTPADNRPGLRSSDGQAWTGGLCLAFDRDGGGLEVAAHNFRNNYEVALSSFGERFLFDNDDDGNQACRLVWALPGGNHGYFSADGSRFWGADRRSGQDTQSAHWHQDDPGVAPMGAITGAGGPTGVAVYESALLAPWIGDQVLACDAGRGLLFASPVRANASGFTLDPKPLLWVPASAQAPDARWMRPSDVVVGLAGELYVADWYDPGVGGHAATDRECFGRILRIAPVGADLRLPAIDLETAAGQLAALDSNGASVRHQAAVALAARGAQVLEPLAALAQGSDARLAARALWILPQLGSAGVAATRALLHSQDQRLSVTALRALALQGADLSSLAQELASSPCAALRRELTYAARNLEPQRRLELFEQLAAQHVAGDRWMLESLGLLAAGVEEQAGASLVAQAGAPSAWSARVVDLLWRLHPAAAISAFEERAAAVELPLAERRRALDALAFSPGREAAEAVLRLVLTGPADLRPLAREWLEQRSTNDWRAYQLLDELASGGRERAVLVAQSDWLTRGSVALTGELAGATRLWLVVEEGDEGNGHDWADWIEPRVTTASGTLALEELGWVGAQAGWGSVHVNANAAGGPLRIDGRTAARGIGTHASSQIEFALPAGALRFETTAAVDDGGSGQSGARSHLRFQVWREGAAVHQRLARELAMLRTKDSSAAERVLALETLAKDPEGAWQLLALAQSGALSDAERVGASEELGRHPDLSLRALASGLFPRAAAGGTQLPSSKVLAAMPGDAARGREVFRSQASQCTRCHLFDGLGKSIGPDLTAVRAKYDRQGLLDAILNPSAGIAFGFDTWLVETVDGRLYSGFLLGEGQELVLKDTEGLRHAIPVDEIESRTPQKLSAMPEGLALGLSAQDLCDLTSFLQRDPAREPERGPTLELFNGLDLGGWKYFLEDPAADASKVWSVEQGSLICQGNPIGYLYTEKRFTNFELELEWRFDPARGPGNSGVLLRRIGEHKVWPRSIEAQLQHRNAGDFWNIDEFAMLAEPTRTSGRNTRKALPCNEKPLGEWNHYRILVYGPRVELWVNGELQNSANWVQELPGEICLQSEGAWIQFRKLELTELR